MLFFHTIYIVGGVGWLQAEWDKVARSKDADIGMHHFNRPPIVVSARVRGWTFSCIAMRWLANLKNTYDARTCKSKISSFCVLRTLPILETWTSSSGEATTRRSTAKATIIRHNDAIDRAIRL
jgi:hypothetical protein